MSRPKLKRVKKIWENDGPLKLINKILRYLALMSFSKIIYYIGGVVPNDEYSVIFGAHRGESYRGNTRQVYEYFDNNQSGVDPVWMTKNKTVYRELSNKDLPVRYIYSLGGIITLARANVGCFTHQVYDIGFVYHGVPYSMELIYMTHGRPVKGKPKKEEKKIRKLFQELTDATEHIGLATAEKYQDVNKLLPSVDLLITDYSSIFNDFLLLDRPIVFVPYDYKVFRERKGLLYDYYNNIPGPAVESQTEFIKEINRGLTQDPYKKIRRNKQELFHKYVDGRSTERVARLVEKTSGRNHINNSFETVIHER